MMVIVIEVYHNLQNLNLFPPQLSPVTQIQAAFKEVMFVHVQYLPLHMWLLHAPPKCSPQVILTLFVLTELLVAVNLSLLFLLWMPFNLVST